MGTDFDFFDPRANTDAPGITAQQRTNRMRLQAAMSAQDFRNYPYEWWHYTLASPSAPEPGVAVVHDVPVE